MASMIPWRAGQYSFTTKGGLYTFPWNEDRLEPFKHYAESHIKRAWNGGNLCFLVGVFWCVFGAMVKSLKENMESGCLQYKISPPLHCPLLQNLQKRLSRLPSSSLLSQTLLGLLTLQIIPTKAPKCLTLRILMSPDMSTSWKVVNMASSTNMRDPTLCSVGFETHCIQKSHHSSSRKETLNCFSMSSGKKKKKRCDDVFVRHHVWTKPVSRTKWREYSVTP